MPGVPVMLQLAKRRCIIIGGGEVALRRATMLCGAGAIVTAVAPSFAPGFETLNVNRIQRGYEHGDCDGAFLVVIATDSAEVNAQAAHEAQRAGALVNRSDDADAGDLTVMAHKREGPLTVAVDTGQTSASLAVRLRDALWASVDAGWPTVLQEAGPWRAWLQAHVPDAAERRTRLRGLTDERALRILHTQGLSALRDHLAHVAGNADHTGPLDPAPHTP